MRGFSFSGKKASSQALDAVVGRTLVCFELFLSSTSPEITAKHGAYLSNSTLLRSCYISFFLLNCCTAFQLTSIHFIRVLQAIWSALCVDKSSLPLLSGSIQAPRRPPLGRVDAVKIGLSDRGGVYNVAPGNPLWVCRVIYTFLFKHLKPLHFEFTLTSNLAVAGNWHVGCVLLK